LQWNLGIYSQSLRNYCIAMLKNKTKMCHGAADGPAFATRRAAAASRVSCAGRRGPGDAAITGSGPAALHLPHLKFMPSPPACR
jgi:hypothetical protein